MAIQFKRVETFTTKPPKEEQAKNGWYIRRNFTSEIVKDEQSSDERLKISYDEAYLTDAEYQIYQIGLEVSQEDTSDAYYNYKQALNTGVVYPANGLTYKPHWFKEANGADGVYVQMYEKAQMLKADGALDIMFPITLSDATDKEENLRQFTYEEFKALFFFLGKTQEEIYNNYKAARRLEI